MMVIVYGALRSGTTLLRLMLDKNAALNCPGETDFLFDFLSFDPDGNAALDRDALQRNRIFQASGLTLNPTLDDVAAVRDLVAQLHRPGAPCLVLMLHRHVAEALRLFPDTPVLHMLRDPRDVARSAIGMGWAGTEYHGAIYWMRTEWDWDRMVTEHPNAKTQDLHYEALIKTPEDTLQSLCAFFGVAFDPDMLNYSEGTTYDAPDVSLVEQWRRKQTPYAIGLVEARLGSLLTNRGYAPSGHPVITPNLMQRVQLLWQDKRAVWSVRIARYGLLDPVLVGLGRRLGLQGLAKDAQQRMNQKQIKYLK